MQKVNTNITKGLCFYVVLVHVSYHLVFVDVFLLLVELGYPVTVETPCPVWITTYFLFKGSMIFWCFAIGSHLAVCSLFLSYLFFSPTFIRILRILRIIFFLFLFFLICGSFTAFPRFRFQGGF